MAACHLQNGDVFFRFCKDLEERRLNKEHLWFLDFKKKVEVIEKTDVHVHTTSILNDNPIPAVF